MAEPRCVPPYDSGEGTGCGISPVSEFAGLKEPTGSVVQAALSGTQNKVPGFAGGYLPGQPEQALHVLL
jgi:hypothetical protein